MMFQTFLEKSLSIIISITAWMDVLPFSTASNPSSATGGSRGVGLNQAARPFYIIGHMANSIESVNDFLRLGANSVESDVQFERNGKVSTIYHGFPCDAARYCWSSTDPIRFFEYLRSLSDEGEIFRN